MTVSGDVKGHSTEGGTRKPLEGKSAEEIFRAHHNLDSNGNLLPGFSAHPVDQGCQCEDCQNYVSSKGKKKVSA